MVLNGEDIQSLHVNTVEIKLWYESFSSKWNGGVVLDVVQGSSCDVPHQPM